MTNSVPKGACCGVDSEPRNTQAVELAEQGRWIELDGMKTCKYLIYDMLPYRSPKTC